MLLKEIALQLDMDPTTDETNHFFKSSVLYSTNFLLIAEENEKYYIIGSVNKIFDSR